LTKRARLLAIAAAVLVFLLAITGVVLSRQRLRRHRVFHPAPPPHRTTPAQLLPVEQWSDQFRLLEATGRWSELHDVLARIAATHPDLYAKWSLSYLDARALLEMDRDAEAAKLFEPYLAAGNPIRDLALFHHAEADEKTASRDRTTLIFETKDSIYRDEAIEDETEYRASLSDVHPLLDLAAKLKRRDIDAHVVEKTGDVAKGLALLRANTSDDAADRVATALDHSQVIAKLNAQQLALIGDAMSKHRHFDHAAVLLARAPASDANTFAIGRAYFGAERYELAQQTYLRGAAATRDMKQKAAFLFHASRCAQLAGDDAGAVQLMTQVLAVPGRTEDHSAALTQRIRTRLKQRRIAEATADLNSVRALFPKQHALVEASLAYALGMLALGKNGAALVTLNAIPPQLFEKYEASEIDYWRGRALESSNAAAAADAYRRVLHANVATHFAYFARQRLHAHPIDPKALAPIYQQKPVYRAVMEMKPEPFPRFPDVPDRAHLLMAMGLFDEAADAIPQNWTLLTRALALNRGNASRESIALTETLMKSVPDDFAPELLPHVVRELLYPRYFYDAIAEDAKKFGADPTLVLAIMREESRFNPRARSQAAARGLLQFIITTARDIGRDAGLVNVTPDDLYDPRIIIRLGSKYVSELSEKLDGNRYRIAAAYNAGPNQTELWTRLQPAPGDDFFLSSINFDETKDYVRKVMNSYRAYEEIYAPTTTNSANALDSGIGSPSSRKPST